MGFTKNILILTTVDDKSDEPVALFVLELWEQNIFTYFWPTYEEQFTSWLKLWIRFLNSEKRCQIFIRNVKNGTWNEMEASRARELKFWLPNFCNFWWKILDFFEKLSKFNPSIRLSRDGSFGFLGFGFFSAEINRK